MFIINIIRVIANVQYFKLITFHTVIFLSCMNKVRGIFRYESGAVVYVLHSIYRLKQWFTYFGITPLYNPLLHSPSYYFYLDFHNLHN